MKLKLVSEILIMCDCLYAKVLVIKGIKILFSA